MMFRFYFIFELKLGRLMSENEIENVIVHRNVISIYFCNIIIIYWMPKRSSSLQFELVLFSTLTMRFFVFFCFTIFFFFSKLAFYVLRFFLVEIPNRTGDLQTQLVSDPIEILDFHFTFFFVFFFLIKCCVVLSNQKK